MRDELAGDPDEVARQIVLRALTMRAHSRHELAETLRKKEIPAESIERVLDRMDEVGLVDDEKFAASWVESRQQRRHLSRRALRDELTRKGVDREVVDQALAEVDPSDEHAAALALAEKKLRSMGRLDAAVKRRRLAGALARKGFSHGIVSAVLAEVLSGPDEDLADHPH
ncbi:hypothetical protein GCM10027418_29520 [Mariniluteicoccus endophyticus]